MTNTVASYTGRVTKAIEDLDSAMKQVSSTLLDPYVSDASASEQFHQLQERQLSFLFHISQVKTALSILRERVNVLSYHVASSNSPEDQSAYDAFVNEHNLTQIQVEAESLLQTLQANRDADKDTLQSLRIHRLATVISEDNTTAPELTHTPQRSPERIHTTPHTSER
ncbi:hypothetical protein Y032_0159g3269 [Ancylostoma ceylanicum]|uniref:Mediator of RNA polymerase II transcription subunit 11 n=1 Tax=Ancylostoma ceylanicum TaxID=53326 RepID=A0A016SYJ1_9BILA|nr:hypothetical protein Y032_0159g3269 [Ancylostoma ceylanicum]